MSSGSFGDDSHEDDDGTTPPGADPWARPQQPDGGAPSGPAPWPQPPPGGEPGSFTAPDQGPWPQPPPGGDVLPPGPGYPQPGYQPLPGYPQSPGYPQPPGYQPQYYGPPTGRNNPFAITALVCGLCQFLLGLLVVGNIVLAIPAIIFGALGLRQIGRRGERGRGMAIAGLVLGILGVVYFLLIILLVVVVGPHVSRSSG